MKKIFQILIIILYFSWFVLILPLAAFASNPYGSAEGAQQYAKEAEAAAAAAAANQTGSSEDLTPVINIKIGQTLLKFEPAKCEVGGTCSIGWLGEYISVIYRYGIGIAAILAVVMIMAGGFLWLISAGSPDKIGKAKEFITAAFTGLFLALFSFIILNAVNPRLTSIEPLTYRATDDVKLDTDGGEGTPERAAAARAARTATGAGGSGSDINLFASEHRAAITEITQQGNQSQSPTTYPGHDNDYQSAEYASDLWPTTPENGDQLAQYLMENHERLGIKYIIWEQHIWNPSRDKPGAWRQMDDRGSQTQNHYDHIHVSFN